MTEGGAKGSSLWYASGGNSTAALTALVALLGLGGFTGAFSTAEGCKGASLG